MASAFVLVVDDEEDVRASIEEALALDGHVTVGVENGEQAIGSLAVARPELVVTDLAMPIRDGHGLIAAMRSSGRTRAIPICVVSAETAELPGEVRAIKKPFELEELRQAVRLALGHRPAGGES